MNSLFVIHPYRFHDQWVFDDQSRQLDKEPFVGGADTLLGRLTDNAEKCSVIFSEKKFPGAHEMIVNAEPAVNGTEGTYYYHHQMDHKLWLCPALLKFFSKPPEQIYLQIKL